MSQESTDKALADKTLADKTLSNKKLSDLPPCMRRKDRAVVEDSWIRNFLSAEPMGVLATAIDSQPFITNNTFYYDSDENAIYMHTADKGQLRSSIEKNPRICFNVAQMGRLLPADKAKEMSVEYSSVIVYGTAHIMTDMQKAIEKMSAFIVKYFPHLKSGEDYRPITDQEIREISVFEIKIDSWTAKKKDAESDFPGAFSYGTSP